MSESVMTTNVEALATRLLGVERDVGNVAVEMRGIASNMTAEFKQVRAEIAAGQRTQWPVIFAGLAVAVGLWGAGIQPLKDSIGTLGTVAAENARQIDTLRLSTVQETDYEADMAENTRQRAFHLEQLGAQLADLQAQITKLADEMVRRGEHEGHWQRQEDGLSANREFFTAAIGNVQRQVDALEERQGAVYGQRDVILDQGEAIEALRGQVQELLRMLPTRP